MVNLLVGTNLTLKNKRLYTIDGCTAGYFYIDSFFTICNSYPNASSILLNALIVGILSFRSIREITCCLFPVNAANSFCVIFSCFRKEIISPISLYSARDSSHAYLNFGSFCLCFLISFLTLISTNGILLHPYINVFPKCLPSSAALFLTSFLSVFSVLFFCLRQAWSKYIFSLSTVI